MLCLENLGEWFGEMERLIGGWWEIDKDLTENRVNHRVNQWAMMMIKRFLRLVFDGIFW